MEWCSACGARVLGEQRIEPAGPREAVAVCPRCGARAPFVWLPLFVVTGASGTGKSTVARRLPSRLPEAVVVDTDLFWAPLRELRAARGRGAYRDLCLAVAHHLHQSGRPVVLLGGAGPDEDAASGWRPAFAAVHYLALVCDDAPLAARLGRRPAALGGRPAAVARALALNRHFRGLAGVGLPAISSYTLLDTSARDADTATAEAAGWVRERLP